MLFPLVEAPGFGDQRKAMLQDLVGGPRALDHSAEASKRQEKQGNENK